MDTPLPARLAYRLWAPTYDAENALTALEGRVFDQLSSAPLGPRLLDVGCGTGRRLPTSEMERIECAVGADLVTAMLAAGLHQRTRDRLLVAADARALPFANGCFDTVWCRLMTGHLTDLGELYREMARTLARHGVLVVTDLHPEAARAGAVRTFRDAAGTRRAVDHVCHEANDHEEAARSVGLTLDARADACVDRSVRRFFEESGRLDLFRQQLGRPMVLALRFRQSETGCRTNDLTIEL